MCCWYYRFSQRRDEFFTFPRNRQDFATWMTSRQSNSSLSQKSLGICPRNLGRGRLQRRQRWIAACRRKNNDGTAWDPKGPNVYICGKHFITGRPVKDPKHPDYIPSIFVFSSNSADRNQNKIARYCSVKRREMLKKQTPKFSSKDFQNKEAADQAAGCSGQIMFGSHNWMPWNAFNGISPTVARKRYRDHCNTVLTRSPKDRLLVFNLKDGWEPLCKFLGKEVPDAPFPHENVKGELVNTWMKENPVFRKMKREMTATTMILSIITGFTLYKFSTSGPRLDLFFWK